MTETLRRTPAPVSLILLILVFGLPPAAGWLFISNPQWLPDRHKNRGTLISPPRPLNELILKDTKNRNFDWANLSGHWTLASYNKGGCESACQQQLHEIQQIRRAVGGERVRIERMLIQNAPSDPQILAQLADQTKGMHLLFLESDNQHTFNKLFSVAGVHSDGAIFLIDPNGMLMMRYGAKNSSKDILKDLEILLKASSNWTKGVNNGHG
jgi:cytochrome oxidase Cu insertion factor (SCO1/SenC/PrrC family)